jgi:hypothetical protein
MFAVMAGALVVGTDTKVGSSAGDTAGWLVLAGLGQTGSAELLTEVRTAFVDALDAMLWVCGGIALAAALLAVAFLPRRGPGQLTPGRDASPGTVTYPTPNA